MDTFTLVCWVFISLAGPAAALSIYLLIKREISIWRAKKSLSAWKPRPRIISTRIISEPGDKVILVKVTLDEETKKALTVKRSK